MSTKNIAVQGILLSIIAVILFFPGLVSSVKFMAAHDAPFTNTANNMFSFRSDNSRFGYAYTDYSYNSYNPTIYSRYAPIAYDAYRGRGPYLMPSNSYNPLYGYKPNYDSHIYIDNALDYTYYNNPWLLEPRYMSNHMWYARGLWPQGFYY
jgi:hypothetical protein